MTYKPKKNDLLMKARFDDLYVNITDIFYVPPAVFRKPFAPEAINEPLSMIHTASGMGGSFTLKYIGREDDAIFFRVANPGFEHWVFRASP